MIETPRIVETTPQLTAALHLTIPQKEIVNVMAPGMKALIVTLAQQKIMPAGPRFSHHLRLHPEIFDFELCIPVTSPIAPTELVKPGIMPARTVARTVYHGPYEGLPRAWGELRAWITAGGHTPEQDLWEVYLIGPDTSDDSSHWRTELNQPIES